MTEAIHCTECSHVVAPDEVFWNRDAASHKHGFHPLCYVKFRWWLAGHSSTPSKSFRDKMLVSMRESTKGKR